MVTGAKRVIQEVTGATTGSYRLLQEVMGFVTGRYNSQNDLKNQIQIGWESFFY